MVELPVHPGFDGTPEVGEVAHHVAFVEGRRAHFDFGHRVVAVGVPAPPGVVEQAMPVAELDADGNGPGAVGHARYSSPGPEAASPSAGTASPAQSDMPVTPLRDLRRPLRRPARPARRDRTRPSLLSGTGRRPGLSRELGHQRLTPVEQPPRPAPATLGADDVLAQDREGDGGVAVGDHRVGQPSGLDLAPAHRLGRGRPRQPSPDDLVGGDLDEGSRCPPWGCRISPTASAGPAGRSSWATPRPGSGSRWWCRRG